MTPSQTALPFVTPRQWRAEHCGESQQPSVNDNFYGFLALSSLPQFLYAAWPALFLPFSITLSTGVSSVFIPSGTPLFSSPCWGRCPLPQAQSTPQCLLTDIPPLCKADIICCTGQRMTKLCLWSLVPSPGSSVCYLNK